MIRRRWNAWFEQQWLVLKRRRFLPWSKADVRWIPLAAVVEIRTLSAVDQTRRQAQIAVQDPTAPRLIRQYSVQFASEAWLQAGALMRDRAATHAVRPQPDPIPYPLPPANSVPAQPSPGRPPTIAGSPTIPRPQEAPAEPAARPTPAATRSTTRVMRAGDGKTTVWLWPQGGKVHASLTPVGKAARHRLDSAEIARLLLAEPSKSLPAIRTLTGIHDDWQAVEHMRTWQQPGRTVVTLSASDLAGRPTPQARPLPAGMNPDGSVRTVSGGLPGLGKRHR